MNDGRIKEKDSQKMRKRLSKEERQRIFSQGPYAGVNNRTSLIEKLTEENTEYANACLFYLGRQLESAEDIVEFHHVIPRFEGGPDDEWNLIPLSHEEHMDLHFLRYQSYQKPGDLLALRFRKKITPELIAAQVEQMRVHHEKMKQQKKGFYDPNLQKELAKRLRRHTEKRESHYLKKVSLKYAALFAKPLKFSYGKIQSVAPRNTFSRTGNIKPYLLNLLSSDQPIFQEIQEDKNFSSSINKVLNNWIPESSPKSRRSNYKGWKIKVLE